MMKRLFSALLASLLLLCFAALAEAPHTSIDLKNDVFLVPVIFEGEASGVLDQPDTQLHFFPGAAQKYLSGSYLWGSEAIPEGYAPAEGGGSVMHAWALKSPTGEQYLPLFTGFDVLFYYYGQNIHVGVISFDEAMELSCTTVTDTINGERIEVDCSGVVLAPGILNQIYPN